MTTYWELVLQEAKRCGDDFDLSKAEIRCPCGLFREIVNGSVTWNADVYGTTMVTNERAYRFLHKPFNNGYGWRAMPRFIMWTEARVYFSHEYDGLLSVQSVPKEPTVNTIW